MKNTIALFALALSLILTFSSCDKNDEAVPKITDQYTLQAIGIATATPVETTIEGVGIKVAGNAFSMDLLDQKTGKHIGTVTDINVAAETFEDGSMKGENYTIFSFDEDNSTLVLHNFIDMTPLDSTTLKAIIQPENTKQNVIGGTGKFANATGGSTLNATLDMSEFSVGTIGFDCIYGIKLN